MISVIVPVYNAENYLCDCLDSIVSQTFSDLEIILIDDGSTDRSGKICDEYHSRDNRIKVMHIDNRGVSFARNLGIKESTGDYVGFVDSDDWIDPTMYESMLSKLEESGSEICVCSYLEEHPTRVVPSRNINDIILNKHDAIYAAVTEPSFDYPWNKLYSRKVIRSIVFPESRTFEDIAAVYKTFLYADKTVCISSQLYHYRIREGSIITRHSMKDLIDFWDAYYDRYSFILTLPEFKNDRFLIDRMQEQLANAAARTWRWIITVPEKDRDKNHLNSVADCIRSHLPVFGKKSWSWYIRLSSPFIRHANVVSYALLYALNYLYRTLLKKK